MIAKDQLFEKEYSSNRSILAAKRVSDRKLKIGKGSRNATLGFSSR